MFGVMRPTTQTSRRAFLFAKGYAMATFEIKLKNSARVAYDGGKINARINGKVVVITTSALNGKRRGSVKDFSDGLRMITTYAASKIGKAVNFRGTKIDPDESATGATFQVFPKDKRYVIWFERNDLTGYVKANVPSFTFSDLASAAQVVAVTSQVAALMQAYEREP
jgi:hypothetical protein